MTRDSQKLLSLREYRVPFPLFLSPWRRLRPSQVQQRLLFPTDAYISVVEWIAAAQIASVSPKSLPFSQLRSRSALPRDCPENSSGAAFLIILRRFLGGFIHLKLANMPKQRRSWSQSFDRRSRASPFPSSSSSHNQPESAESAKDIKEWEEVRCPVCMEHPHNAVLLLCSSHDKGCRPFMCDTSYRHSNCLDQYRKAFSGSKPPQDNGDTQQPTKLSCPLCRGSVTGWTVVEPARRYMNAKTRSCSTESCAFSGIYGELRKHARKEHPSVRPSEADPERQQDWRRMERQRDLGDLFSMFRSAVTREEDEVNINEDDEETNGSMFIFPSVTMFLVVHVHREGGNDTGRSSLPRSFISSSLRGSSRGRRRSGVVPWGESLSNSTSTGTLDGANDDEVNNDGGSDVVDTTSQQNQGRQRRQVWMSDDDGDDDDDDDVS
ncbi:uncharacterized protein LOC135673435 isoform X1 [Musa acuminata AAA Group]